ncbi:MAG: radical SAM protein [FCB group bacterium]|nr:radical SAM protein [FCB group bacterium]
MLTGIHFLLSYSCNYECDHCFVFSSPRAKGTFTSKQIKTVLDEALTIGTINEIYFEGGEPFLFYPVLLEGIRMAHERGFTVGIVSNAYWAISEEDAILWLRPLKEAGLTHLSVSDDQFHGDDEADRPPLRAVAAARKLGLDTGSICIEAPIMADDPNDTSKGEKVVGGGAILKGRAVEKLADGLPRTDWKGFDTCPYEDFADPQRVHVDAYGHVHICQGVSMGNMWTTPLTRLAKEYSPADHPVSKILLDGGPAELAQRAGFDEKMKFVDACHVCYCARKKLINSFPDVLAPNQVYGIE